MTCAPYTPQTSEALNSPAKQVDTPSSTQNYTRLSIWAGGFSVKTNSAGRQALRVSELGPKCWRNRAPPLAGIQPPSCNGTDNGKTAKSFLRLRPVDQWVREAWVPKQLSFKRLACVRVRLRRHLKSISRLCCDWQTSAPHLIHLASKSRQLLSQEPLWPE